MTVRSVTVAAAGRSVDIEYAWVEAGPAHPVVVFLHEGLGSLSMWKDFPARLCGALGMRGLVYSRPGYGQSTPRANGERWPVGFMHREASEVLPALLAALEVPQQSWLFGHSDGASIALIHAATAGRPVAGVIALAPHVKVEDLSVASIRKAREAYVSGELRERLERHHEHVDAMFWGWNDIWLADAFRSWNIEALLPQIACPILAIQGLDDEYGTLGQIESIARAVPRTRLLELAGCRHSPHRDQPAAVLRATAEFMGSLG